MAPGYCHSALLVFFTISSIHLTAASGGNPALAIRQTPQPCNTWELSAEAWVQAGTDQYLASILETAQATGQRFDAALGHAISYNDFHCRIGDVAGCAVISCKDFDNATQYYAAVGVQNLNVLLNVIFDGTVIGQIDATNLADDLADKFFRWKDPLYLGAAIAHAVNSAVTAIVTFGLATTRIPLIHPRTTEATNAAAAVAGGAAGVVGDSLRPLAHLTRESGIRDLNDLFYYSSNNARHAIEDLANLIFSGKADNNSNTILEYLAGGNFVYASSIPYLTLAENYYKTNLVARTVNALYREKQTYVVSTTVPPKYFLKDYPEGSSWTSPGGRTYTLYSYQKKKPQQPEGLDVLNGSYYNINAWQIAKSSGEAWEVAGYDYSNQISQQELFESFGANSNYTPFQDRAGWQGTFTIPVCDVGDHAESMVDYGEPTLPCCCGIGCRDTRAFVEAANLNKTRSWYYRCRKQLKGTELNIQDIDYGIDLGSRATQFWDRLSKGERAGFIIGILIAGFVALVIAICILFRIL